MATCDDIIVGAGSSGAVLAAAVRGFQILRLLVIAALVLSPLPSLPVFAQQPAKIHRIGVLSTAGPEQENFVWADLRRLLRERGWVEGQNLAIEFRYAEGRYERLQELAAELVRLEPDLIMARGGPGATAAKRATATIPTVFYSTTDPVGIGLVQSLARPGGNITGLTDDTDPEILGKQLQLLKDVAPTASKVAFLFRVPPSAVVPVVSRYEAALENGAKSLGVAAAAGAPAGARRYQQGVWRVPPGRHWRPPSGLRRRYVVQPAADHRSGHPTAPTADVHAPDLHRRRRPHVVRSG